MKFAEKIKAGTATLDDFVEAVSVWHDAATDQSVYQFLGITKQEYGEILTKHRTAIDELILRHRARGGR